MNPLSSSPEAMDEKSKIPSDSPTSVDHHPVTSPPSQAVAEKATEGECTEEDLVGKPATVPCWTGLLERKASYEVDVRRPVGISILRLAHDSIRGGIEDCEEALLVKDLPVFKGAWADLCRGIKTHMLMEEGGINRLLEEHFEEIKPVQETIDGLHSQDMKLNENVHDALAHTTNDPSKLSSAFHTWCNHHRGHLNQEEVAIMPRVSELCDEFEDRSAPGELETVFNRRVISKVTGELPFFVGWNCRMLEKHKCFPHVRMFVTSLQSCTTPSQWAALLPEVEQNVSRSCFQSLQDEFDIAAPGKVSEPDDTGVGGEPVRV